MIACRFEPCEEKVAYKAKDGKGVCRDHSPLYFAAGIVLDRLNENLVTAARILEPQLRRLTENPNLWTRDKKAATRVSRGNRVMG